MARVCNWTLLAFPFATELTTPRTVLVCMESSQTVDCGWHITSYRHRTTLMWGVIVSPLPTEKYLSPLIHYCEYRIAGYFRGANISRLHVVVLVNLAEKMFVGSPQCLVSTTTAGYKITWLWCSGYNAHLFSRMQKFMKFKRSFSLENN